MKDSRAIDPKSLDAFVDEKGALNSFLRFAQKHEELNICFRGNHNAIEIYYLNHVVWKLSRGRKGYYKVSFNFGHAKGMPEGNEHLKYFVQCGFKILSDEKTICWEKDQFKEQEINEEFWQHLYAQRVNGISPKMVSDAPCFSDVREEIQRIFDNASELITYNGRFDIGFLAAAGIEFKDIPSFDVMLAFAPIYGEWSNHYGAYKWKKLTTCADYYGYRFNAHDSLEDVRATLYCYKKIVGIV